MLNKEMVIGAIKRSLYQVTIVYNLHLTDNF